MPNENLEKLVQYARDKKPTDFKAVLTTEIGSRIAAKMADMKQTMAKTMFSKKVEVTEEKEVEHTHEDGTTHSHVGGDKEHTHEAKKEEFPPKKDDDEDDEDEKEKDAEAESSKDESVKKEGKEGGEGDKAAYQKFFASILKKYGVKDPSELSGEKKKKFYDEVDAGWKLSLIHI